MKGEHLSHAAAPPQRAVLLWVGFLLGASNDKVAESRETVGASCLRLEVSGVRCVKVGRYDVDESM